MKQKEKNGKKRRTKGERTYRPCVGREMTAYDIRIMGHGTLSSKAIRAISINHPREM